MGTTTSTTTACPTCAGSLASAGPGTRPWCPECEWNLDVHDRLLAPWRGTTLLGRWGYRRGVRLDERVRAGLLAEPDATTPGRTTGETWLVGVSALVVLLGLGAVAYLVWVVVGSGLPVGVRLVLVLPGVAVLALALPSVGRLPEDLVVPEEQAPALYALVRDVAAAAGTPAPDVVAVDLSMNAAVAHLGWRQRSVLVIGMPFWLTMSREARVAVLAHEVGHLANGDPLRLRQTLPARTFGARAVAATGGRNPWRRVLMGTAAGAEYGAGVVGFLVHGLLAVVNVSGATVQLLVDSVAMPDSRLAEYRADLAARRVAGTSAFLESSTTVLVCDEVWSDLWHLAPRIDGEGLEQAAAVARGRLVGSVRTARQLSRRTTDLWSTHPAEDRRMSLVESLPVVEGTLRVDDARWGAVDRELAPWRTRAHRALLGTRDRF